MSPLASAYQDGVNDALLKLGATRGLREIRKAMSSGNMGRANQLAADPRMFSPGQMTMGSVLPGNTQHLGRGGEGLATKVIHPAAAQHNIATGSTAGPMGVRKLFDPAGNVSSPEIARRKAEDLRSMPGMPKVLASGTTRYGTPVHINELVQGRAITKEDMANPQFTHQFEEERKNTLAAGRAHGYELADLRPQNALATPSGPKFIDAMPLKPSETLSPAAQRARNRGRLFLPHQMPVTPEASKQLFAARDAAQRVTPEHLRSNIPIGEETARQFDTDRPTFDAKKKQREAENYRAFTQHMLGRPAGQQQPASAYQPTPVDRLREQLAQRNFGNAPTAAKPVGAPAPIMDPASAPTAASFGRRPPAGRHTGMSEFL